MNSMTGFGKAELKTKLGKIRVEISSVNNRYLEISPRTPRSFFGFDPKIKDVISQMISRGKINLYISFEEKIDDSSKNYINKDLSKVLFNQLTKLKKELKITSEITIHDLLLIPEITKPETATFDEKAIWAALEKTLRKALAELIVMRKKEGQELKNDMKKRLKILSTNIKEIEKLSAQCVNSRREKVTQKLQDILKDSHDNSVRIEEEIAILAERTDIAEECIRTYSHLKQYKSALEDKNPVGKKMNFILQELNREVNTIASKCSDISISSTVIQMKEEIEKLREQVQNIE